MLRLARQCAAVGTVVTFAAACASRTPVEMPMQYSAPSPAPEHELAASTVCTVHIAGIRDLRTDPHSLGGTTGREVHVEDSTAWIRSGIESLRTDGAFYFSGRDDGTALSLDVELLKGYVMNITGETRSAAVVLRIRYARGGQALGEQLYRGSDNELIWTGSGDETQSALNAVLAKALQAIRGDMLSRCTVQAGGH